MFFVLLLLFTSSCSKYRSKSKPLAPPRKFNDDAPYSNDDDRRETFEDFGDPVDIDEESYPKIKDYYRVHYYHFI